MEDSPQPLHEAVALLFWETEVEHQNKRQKEASVPRAETQRAVSILQLIEVELLGNQDRYSS